MLLLDTSVIAKPCSIVCRRNSSRRGGVFFLGTTGGSRNWDPERCHVVVFFINCDRASNEMSPITRSVLFLVSCWHRRSGIYTKLHFLQGFFEEHHSIQTFRKLRPHEINKFRNLGMCMTPSTLITETYTELNFSQGFFQGTPQHSNLQTITTTQNY